MIKKLIITLALSIALTLGACGSTLDASATTPAVTVEQAYVCKDGVTKAWVDDTGDSVMVFTHTDNGMGDAAVLIYINETGVEKIVGVYTVAQGESLILEYINQGGSGHWTSCSESIQSKVDPNTCCNPWDSSVLPTKNIIRTPHGLYVLEGNKLEQLHSPALENTMDVDAMVGVSEQDFDTNECPLHIEWPAPYWLSISELFDTDGDGQLDDYTKVVSYEHSGTATVVLKEGHIYVVTIYNPITKKVVAYQTFRYSCEDGENTMIVQ